MATHRLHRVLFAAAACLAALPMLAGARESTAAVQPAALFDANLVRTYEIPPGGPYVSVTVCGTLPGAVGCSGPNFPMGPFGKVGPVVEGVPSFVSATNTVNRYVYAVDLATNGGSGVSLLVYRLSITNRNPGFDVGLKLVKTLPLGLVGGSSAKGFMAANRGFVFVGTDQDPHAVKVTKNGYELSTFQVTYPAAGNISGMSANNEGYVMISQSSGATAGSAEYGPDGNFFQNSSDLTTLGTMLGITPRTNAIGTAATPLRMIYTRVKQGTAPTR